MQQATIPAQQVGLPLEVQHHQPVPGQGPTSDTHGVLAATYEPGEVRLADRAVVPVTAVDGLETRDRRFTDQEVIEVLFSICPAIYPVTASESPRKQPRSNASHERPRRRVLVLPAWYPWLDRPGLGSFCRDQAEAVSFCTM